MKDGRKVQRSKRVIRDGGVQASKSSPLRRFLRLQVAKTCVPTRGGGRGLHPVSFGNQTWSQMILSGTVKVSQRGHEPSSILLTAWR